MTDSKAESSSRSPAPEEMSATPVHAESPIPVTAEHTVAQASTVETNSSDLVDKARTFLLSPQVVHQDIPAKRAFLREKGLDEAQIDSLLTNLPIPPPTIPPKTYPRPPPSNLPVVFLGLARLFTWLAGGSILLLLLYRRFLFPRIAQTWLARHSLRSHQLMLMRQLNTSLTTLKETQTQSYSILPHSDTYKELKKFSDCKSITEILKVAADGEKEADFVKLPIISLLRCGIKELGGKPTTEELFRHLEGKIPRLLTDVGLEFEQQLWDALSTTSLFSRLSNSTPPLEIAQEQSSSVTQWEYNPPAFVSAPPLLKSLDVLSSELPKDVKSRKSPFQHTLQSMSDFTGYLSTQVYLPFRPSAVGYSSSANGQSTIEDELRREIRALKGLVLNRRSFMPSIPRPGLASNDTSTIRTTP